MSATAAATDYSYGRLFDSSTVSNTYIAAEIKERLQSAQTAKFRRAEAVEADVFNDIHNFAAVTRGYTSNARSAFSTHFAKLAKLREEDKPSWASYVGCKRALESLHKQDFQPTRVVTSAEGGLAICFIKGDIYCDLEFLDSGEVLGVISNRRDRPMVWEINARDNDMSQAINRIRQFLDTPEALPNDQGRSWFRSWFSAGP